MAYYDIVSEVYTYNVPAGSTMDIYLTLSTGALKWISQIFFDVNTSPSTSDLYFSPWYCFNTNMFQYHFSGTVIYEKVYPNWFLFDETAGKWHIRFVNGMTTTSAALKIGYVGYEVI
jgi:hypothetical protein